MNALKRLTYRLVANDSRNMGKVGKFFNWQWLKDEADENEKNPGRAIGKAAGYAASMYLGGLLGGAGGAGAGAGSAAGGGAAELATVGAQQATEQAAIQAAQQAAMQAAAEQGGAGLLGQAPQGFANTMEAGQGMGLLDTGYTPSTAFNAIRYGADSGQGIGGSLGKWASAKGSAMAARPMGTMGDMAEGYSKSQALANSFAPPPQQPPPPPPPRQQEQQRMPEFGGYGQQGLLGGVPPELAGLPPDDPRVLEWMRKMGRMQ